MKLKIKKIKDGVYSLDGYTIERVNSDDSENGSWDVMYDGEWVNRFELLRWAKEYLQEKNENNGGE